MDDNTIVVYTSDHGDMAGEHRMWWKSSFYEGSVGVPLVFSWPGRFAEGKQVSAVTNIIDVGPTLLDLVDAEPLPFAAGRSMTGFLSDSGSVVGWPDQTFAECFGRLDDRPSFMVRRGPWKLNYYHGYEVPQLREEPSHGAVGLPGQAALIVGRFTGPGFRAAV